MANTKKIILIILCTSINFPPLQAWEFFSWFKGTTPEHQSSAQESHTNYLLFGIAGLAGISSGIILYKKYKQKLNQLNSDLVQRNSDIVQRDQQISQLEKQLKQKQSQNKKARKEDNKQKQQVQQESMRLQTHKKNNNKFRNKKNRNFRTKRN